MYIGVPFFIEKCLKASRIQSMIFNEVRFYNHLDI